MKKILYASIVGVLIVASSCSKDFLDIPSQGTQTSEDFLSKPENAPMLVNATYNELLNWRTSSFSWIGVSSITSDDAEKGSDPGDTGADKDQLDNFTFTPTSGSFKDVWDGNLQGMTKANLALRNLPLLSIEEAYKGRLMGEAYFLRAHFLFTLVKCFGEVPLIDFVPDPKSETDFKKTWTKAPKAELYARIESDLKQAVKLLPESYSAPDLGRATQGAAKSLLAKVSMYEGKWDEALTLTNEVIQSNRYGLTPNYGEIWREIGENNKESIFEIQGRGVDPAKGVQGYVACQGVRGQWGWGFNTPSEDLDNAYEPGDVRRMATIMHSGDLLWDGERVNSVTPNPRYSYKAYLSRTKESFNGGDWESNKNIRILRYGEILLINAEAANEKDNPTKALESLNKVRSRAGLAAITVTEKGALRNAIWKERRVELAMEHDRFFDLVRQGRADIVLKAHGKNFVKGKNEVFPIPQSVIDNSKGLLKQNSGY